MESAAMKALLRLQKAREGVTWPAQSKDPTFPSQVFYALGRIFCMSKHLEEIVRGKLGV